MDRTVQLCLLAANRLACSGLEFANCKLMNPLKKTPQVYLIGCIKRAMDFGSQLVTRRFEDVREVRVQDWRRVEEDSWRLVR